MDNDHLLILIEKYINGEASKAEQKWVENWYASFDHAADWLKEDGEEAADIKLELRQSISEKLDGIHQLNSVHQQVFAKRFGRYLRWAAAVLLVVGSATALFFLRTPAKEMETLMAEGKSRIAALPDGSVVWLQAGSNIRYVKDFSGSQREILLQGEARFDIAANARPFVVKTGSMVTQVLGTVFNINAYPERDSFTVTVLKGRVQVSKEQTIAGVLGAGDRLVSKGKSVIQYKASSQQLAELENGEIQFDKQTLREIMVIFEQWYGYSLQVNDSSILEQKYTGSFHRNGTMEDLLSIICEVNNINYQINNQKQQIILSRKK